MRRPTLRGKQHVRVENTALRQVDPHSRAVGAGLLGTAVLAEPGKAGAPKEPATGVAAITVPPGFVVELVAAPPLVEHPMMAASTTRAGCSSPRPPG